MMKHLSLLLTTTALFLLPNIANAQTYTPSNRNPVADRSIGTVVNPTGTNNNFNIEGGLQRGQNLFHSFTDFSIPTGGAANFTNPAGNQSIITRVTGNLFSDLNGTLNTNGANFLLINPNGVVFGTNARLNVGKAFVTSTASGVDFVDAAGRNYNFGTNRAGDASLLSIDPNVAFNPARLTMSASIPGSKGIENYGTLETKNQGQYIGLIGGNVTFDGGYIKASGGRVDIGGLNSAGTVSIGNEGLVFAGNGLTRSDVSLPDTVIDVSIDRKLAGINTFFSNASFLGSSINISGNNLQLDKAILISGLNNSGVQTVPTGNINIDAIGKLTLSEATILNSISAASGGAVSEGQLGNININADSLVGNNLLVLSTIADGGKGSGGNINIKIKGDLTLVKSSIYTTTFGEGDAGRVSISSNGKLSLQESEIYSDIISTAIGNSKGIKIDAGELELTNQSSIRTGTQQSALVNGKGNAGDIDIKTKGNLTISGTNDPAKANDNLNYFDNNNRSYISSTSLGSGNSGKITIDAGGKLLIERGTVDTSISSRLVDKNGAIVASGSFKITDFFIPNQRFLSRSIVYTPDWPRVVANTSIGNSQSITINARELEMKDNSQLLSETGGKGNAGDIKIGTTGNATIALSTIATNIGRYGDGKTGKVSIDVGGKLILKDNVRIQSIVAGGIGDSQGIDIKANTLDLLDGSGIYSQTLGRGNAGDIQIATTGDVTFSAPGSFGRSVIYSSSNIPDLRGYSSLSLFAPIPDLKGAKYSAGNINISSKGLLLDRGYIVSASDLGQGGNIKLTMSDKLLLRGTKSAIRTEEGYSAIATDSGLNSEGDGIGGGNGGNITISSPLIIALPGNNDITANANQGDGGRVNITSQGLFGIQYRPTGTAFTNDITASSTFGQSGNVQINTPGIDPGKDTGELPATPNDASKQISQTCGASQRENKFYITGRGGLPPNASDPQESEALWQDDRATKTKPATTANQPAQLAQLAPPAIGWVFEKDGRVRLIAAQTAGGTTGSRVVCPNK
jgi:filamentous hemagglutinin family protein